MNDELIFFLNLTWQMIVERSVIYPIDVKCDKSIDGTNMPNQLCPLDQEGRKWEIIGRHFVDFNMFNGCFSFLFIFFF